MSKGIMHVTFVSSEEFYNFVYNAKVNNKNSAFVDLYNLSEYETFKVLMIVGDDIASVAITDAGDIVSIIKNEIKKDELENVIDILMPIAIINGGKTLNCYSSTLCKKYIKHGFFPVSKVKFDRNYAPNDWNYEKNGEPNIYFCCRYTSIDKLVSESTSLDVDNIFELLDNVIPVMDYNSAKEYCINLFQKLELCNYSFNEFIFAMINGNLQRGGTVKK